MIHAFFKQKIIEPLELFSLTHLRQIIMSSHSLNIPATRQRLYHLAQAHYFSPLVLRSALRMVGIIPSSSDWRRFIEHILLSLGLTLFLSGVIFFFAYNWANMNRFVKFAILEVGLVILLILIVWRGLEALSGKLTLLGASVFVGVLLAVYGQIYQTGAEVFTLFLTWALFIFPWVIISRFAPLWFLFLLLSNLTLTLYWSQTVEVFHHSALFLFLYALNSLAFILWESAFRFRIAWLSSHQWLGRIIFMAILAVLLVPTLEAIITLESITPLGFSRHEEVLSLMIVLYLATTMFGLAYFSQQRRDLFLLAVNLGGILITLTTLLARWFPLEETPAWFFLGLVVIGEVYLITTFLFNLAKKWGEAYD